MVSLLLLSICVQKTQISLQLVIRQNMKDSILLSAGVNMLNGTA